MMSWYKQVLMVAMFASLCSPAIAAVPTAAIIDGVLTSTGGSAAADGDYNVVFTIFDAATNGNAVWTESSKITVSGGRFSYGLGSTTPFDTAKLIAANAHWLALKIGADPELPRQKLQSSIFSMVAGEALKLSCDGCVGSNHLANGSVAAAKIGFNFAGSSTKGGPAADVECTGCIGTSEMKFDGDVDLAGNSIKAKNGTFSGDVAAATVTATSFVGDGSKLTGIKTASGECKTAGEVVKGINADGSLKCVAALDPAALPKDGLNEISNDLISNQFIDTIQGTAGVKIPDNTGSDANSTLDFADIGVAQAFELYVEVANTDLSKVSMIVLPPDDKKTGWTLCDPCGKTDEKSFKATFSKDNLPKSGDLAKWIGANPKGIWNLKVLDAGFCVPQAPGNAALCDTNGKTDGSIVAWNIKIQTLSNKKIAIAGNTGISGDVTVSGGVAVNGDVTAANLNTALGYRQVVWENSQLDMTATSWTNARAMTFDKKRADTVLIIDHVEGFNIRGYYGWTEAGYRVLIDGAECTNPGRIEQTWAHYSPNSTNIHSGDLIATHAICKATTAGPIGIGKHTIQAQGRRSYGDGNSWGPYWSYNLGSSVNRIARMGVGEIQDNQ